jgi:hypothetical protein
MLMIAPVRNGYARRVGGSRVAAGARNVAKMGDAPVIEALAGIKRTGAQEESLIREGAENTDDTTDSVQDGTDHGSQGRHLAGVIGHSLGWDERLRAAADAYRFTIEKLDKDHQRHKPGDVYDAQS